MDNSVKVMFLGIIIILFGYSYTMTKDQLLKDPIRQQYDLLKHYLLNDSSLAQSNKPLLWIHVDYKQNARNWLSFYSRNTTNLNQAYQYLTIKSIIDKCSEHFNVCIIDDTTFHKIIPGWTIQMNNISDPIKQNIRTLAMCKILYSYGGLVVPSTFICLKDLYSLYSKDEFTYNNKCSMMSSPKQNNELNNYIIYLETTISTDFTDEFSFKQKDKSWLTEQSNIQMISSSSIGIEDINGTVIQLEHLMSDAEIKLSPECLGVIVNENELLTRTKYNWFCKLSDEEVLNSHTNIGHLLLQ